MKKKFLKVFQRGVKTASPVQNVEQIARNGFPVFSHLLLVDVPLHKHDKLIPVLLDHESHELLLMKSKSSYDISGTIAPYLCHIHIRLHH